MTLEQLVRARNSIADRMCEIWLAPSENPRKRACEKVRFYQLRSELLSLDSQIAAAMQRQPGANVEIRFAPNAMPGTQLQGQH